MDVYHFKIALREISPMVWRRLNVAGNTDLGDLHIILQLAMGWKDYHLHAFHIYGKDYGTYKPGGMLFEDDPKKVFLSDFHFRIGDRFVFDYDFTAGWLHDIRVEAIETTDTEVIGFCRNQHRTSVDGIMKDTFSNDSVTTLSVSKDDAFNRR
jgi:hypothetical protein